MSKEVSSHWILKNLIGAAVFVVAFAVLANLVLGVLTHHGKYVQVPDLAGLEASEARRVAEHSGLRVEVTDSVFSKRAQRGAVNSHIPKAGTDVKTGRKIRLTINSVIPKKVTMPDLVGLSLRQARAELSSRGLYLGKITYVSDEATNIVLKQTYRNAEIRKGRQIESEATVDLVVGLNDQDYLTRVPNVVGMKYLRAADVLQDNSLNVGRLRFDETCKTYQDSLFATVVSQNPAPSSAECQMGSEVSLTLTKEPAKSKR